MRFVKPGRGNSLVRVHHCNNSSLRLSVPARLEGRYGPGTREAGSVGQSRYSWLVHRDGSFRFSGHNLNILCDSRRTSMSGRVQDSDSAVRLAQAAAGASTAAAAAWGRGLGPGPGLTKVRPGPGLHLHLHLRPALQYTQASVNDQVTVTVTEWQSRCHGVFGESDYRIVGFGRAGTAQISPATMTVTVMFTITVIVPVTPNAVS